jgi:hypothetical protein
MQSSGLTATETVNAFNTYENHTFRGIAKVLIEILREFNPQSGKAFLVDDSKFVTCLESLCNDLKVIFKAEKRLIKINSPAYVLSDICGHLPSLLSLETTLWNRFPLLLANYVFLGNNLMAGQWGVECIVYLIAFKVMFPHKVFLLRGRQEVKIASNPFNAECLAKYGDSNGQRIHDCITSVFESMPIALTVDETVFCVNSGIPNTKSKVIPELNNMKEITEKTNLETTLLWQVCSRLRYI